MLKACTVLLCLALASCSGVDVRNYSQEKPTLELREFFEGRVEAWGIFQKRSGEVAKRFHVVINGHSEGSKLILDEAFTYSDGTKQKRVWTLTPDGPGQWRGTAGDVVGEARGETAGNALRWRYVLRLPVDGEEYDVELDDWMYLMDDKTLINRSYMSKFGVEIGQITLFFRK
ncbi:DUF3833 domain-containing protein [Pseudomonas granadensis]|uniref:DUF3833 domain-containing protein n=1 Tax=Pseudomonas granadensis TaxID=1421430 RepID=UPI0019D12A0D|nr:DUF3833 domain-containing protein [Pseudomonas granadensis]MBN6774315.1 DUF3833 domain-containing protein [Pseudomonas granadensis]MBN6805211.1 DUF3833 domain-containing protein [Pseudomonas granadensis]MBN6832341.1 DUF3833 domain-containing protein [Pseudomonas granadensis]MBN6839405.1 DUF3833 domain-containing protein [Pseudomonas granadensis]MBN6868764.1 DUF3833 domain-containing protein [Pseudomonas granadensis]